MSIKSFFLFTVLLLLAAYLFPSYYAPKRHVIENSEHYFIEPEHIKQEHIENNNRLNSKQQCRYNENNTALNSTSIKIISWNTMAACRKKLKQFAAMTFCNSRQSDQSFIELARNKDLLIIQEAYVDYTMSQLLKSLGDDYTWDMAVSYIADKKLDIPTGVLTAANAQALSACPLRTYETFLPTPKAILFTTYNLADENDRIIDKKLLVVNIHGILISRKYLYQQLQLMAKEIAKHEGPVILAGDFNTMTSDSYHKLTQIITALDLTESEINTTHDYRVKSVTEQVYDFIFYKGLIQIKAQTINLKTGKNGETSDHNPILAEFKYKFTSYP